MFPRTSLALTLLLFLAVQILSTGECWTGSQKQRHKREWVVPAKRFTENVDYSHLRYVAKFRSDNDESVRLLYTLRGPGANQPPVGNFVVDTYKGYVRITRPLDREERQNYTLIGTAWYANNTIAEDNIKINVIVEDQNDNPPVFIQPERSSVFEGSPVGTLVTQVVAKDADEPNTNHTKIAYSLIKQEPNNGMLFFAVDKDNGTISLANTKLDREQHRSFVLTVQAADMYGNPEGMSTTATVIIDILDVNDNIPTLEKDEFSADIDENEAPVEVLRIQALDNDEERTDNWLAEFEIVSGNEDGRFSIETDPKTNMGILYLNKPVDFESASDMNLNLVVSNKAPPGAPLGSGAGAAGAGGASGAGGGAGASGAGGAFGASGAGGGAGASGAGGAFGASGAGGHHMDFSSSGQKKYLIKINVKNKPEAPKFKPKVKPISVSENPKDSFPRVIANYTAIEEDTGKAAENVKYAKAYDPDNWISIDMNTAEIKLNKLPDHESPFVVNGTYYAKILCITDELHSQTSTGTIALQVEDQNDNCPKLLNSVQTLCIDTRMVNITAEDKDSGPNGAPLEFKLIQEKTKGKWNLQQINDVSALLFAEGDLWPGFYDVTMEIRDKQGLACPDEQVLQLEVCTCSEGVFCVSKVAAIRTTSANFGAAGIGFLILGLLCLILGLMAIIKCDVKLGKRFIDMPTESSQRLSYCTEENRTYRDVFKMGMPPKRHNKGSNEIKSPQKPLGMVEAKSKIPENKTQAPWSNQAVNNSSNMVGMMQKSAFGGFYYDVKMENSAKWQEENVTLDAFLKKYLASKSRFLSDNDYPKQGLKQYDYEGEGSVTCSNGNLSFIESNEDLEFLNNLSSEFKTLADVCGFRQTDPKVIENTAETTPNADASSNHTTNIVHPSPEDIPVKPPLVQPAPNQGIVIQEPMYFGLPMASNVLLSEDGFGQGVYVINGNPEAGRIQTQGNSHTLAYLGSGQQAVLANNTIGDSVFYSQIGHQSPVMITEGLGEVNPVVIQNLSPTSELVLMPQQQLEGIGSLQNGQGRITLTDGSANKGQIFVSGLGPSHHPTSPQLLYPVSYPQELSGMVHMNQTVVDGSLTSTQNAGKVTSPVNGSNVLIRRPGTPVPQIPTGQLASKKGGESTVLVSGHSILEAPVSGGNLLVTGPSQYPVSVSTGTPNLARLPQFASGQVNNSELSVNGVQNIVSGPIILEGSGQLFRSTGSKVLTSVATKAKMKANGQLHIKQ